LITAAHGSGLAAALRAQRRVWTCSREQRPNQRACQ
jgi:hypothetical protein